LCFDDSETGVQIAGQVTAAFFDSGTPSRTIAERALTYRKKYGRAPGKEHIDDLFDDFLGGNKADAYRRVIEGLYQQAPGLNSAYLATRIAEFTRRQILKAAVLKAAEEYQTVRDDVADRVEDVLRKALDQNDNISKANGRAAELVLPKMSEMTMRPIAWMWPAMIPYGKLTLIAGDPKLGKSTAGLSLIATLTTGGIWPDGARCDEPLEAVIMSTEDDPEDTILPRLVAMGADIERCYFLRGVRLTAGGEEQDFDMGRDLAKLEQFLEEHPKVAMVLIEPVVAHVNPKDSSSEGEIRRKLRPLTKLAQRYQVAFVGIMHFRKSGDAATPVHMIAGSLAYGAVAQVAYAVVKDKNDGDRRLLLTMGNNLAMGNQGFAYRLRGLRLERGITATVVDWEGPVEITAEEAMARDNPKEAIKKADAAEAWLRTRLIPGAVTQKQIKEEVEAMGGWSWKTVERAADKIDGLTKQKEGFRGISMWSYRP